jgi:L-rhamnose mutarotase
MARVTWTARLRPEKIEEYVVAHGAVWPDMLAMISEAGVRNYSIHLFEDRVFGYYECDDPVATKAFMRDAEVTTRWNAAMAPLFAPEVATEGLIELPEVFRLD